MKISIVGILDSIMSNESHRKNREIILLSTDVFMVLIAYGLATVLKANMDVTRIYFDFRMGLWLVPFIIMAHMLMLIFFNVHQSLWRYFGIKEVKNISLAMVSSSFVVMIYAYLVSHSLAVVSYIILAEMMALIFIFAVRFIYRALRDTRAGTDKHINVLIIGAGDGGYIMLKDLIAENSGERVVGFIDDNRNNKIIAGYKVLGTTEQLEMLVAKHNIKKVYIAMPSIDLKYQKSIFEKCQELKMDTKVMKKADHRVGGSKGKQLQYPVENVSIDDLLGRGEVHLNHEQILSYISGKNILVTGAAGSIGSELCRQILKHSPNSLVMLDLNENALYMLELEIKSSEYKTTKLHSYVASVRDPIELNRIMDRRDVDVVYHAAAHKHVPLMESRPQEAFKNNVLGTKNVIEACINNKVSHFVLISTDKAVNPTNVMGASKRMCEMLLQANGNNGVTKMGAVRFGNVLGSNGSVIPIFNEQIKRGGPVMVTHEDITRYFMTIPEAAQLVLQAGYYADKGSIYVLDMGEPVKIYDLAVKLIQLSGYQPNQDINIEFNGLRPGEKMYEELSLDSEVIEKTENDLIYINLPQTINVDKLYKDIEELSSLIEQNVKKKVIREFFLSCIK